MIVSARPASRVHVGREGRRPLSSRGAGTRTDQAVREFTAVDAVDFDIELGEAFGFLGANGAGKTSTMRMIACLSPISDGTLQVLGLDPMHDGPQIRSRIGLVRKTTRSTSN